MEKKKESSRKGIFHQLAVGYLLRHAETALRSLQTFGVSAPSFKVISIFVPSYLFCFHQLSGRPSDLTFFSIFGYLTETFPLPAGFPLLPSRRFAKRIKKELTRKMVRLILQGLAGSTRSGLALACCFGPAAACNATLAGLPPLPTSTTCMFLLSLLLLQFRMHARRHRLCLWLHIWCNSLCVLLSACSIAP